MTADSFILVTDTPSVKQFVFGTDALAEIRGASALLDRLNRRDTVAELQKCLAAVDGRVDKVYANGGSGQFLIRGASEEHVRSAVRQLNRQYREKTGGEVRLSSGLARFGEARGYQEAVRAAHLQMRSQRETAFRCRSTPLLPFIKECRSASHLPACCGMPWGNEGVLLLSDASRRKRDAGRRSREAGVWREWMQHLAGSGPWPDENQWERLRCDDFNDMGEQALRRGYVGLIYADGNAMGRLVQELDSVEACRQFSDIVDSSIREACFVALASTCHREVARMREAAARNGPARSLPADVLLLGGDDLLVLLPADRALPFALKVTEEFEKSTRSKIGALTGDASAFFAKRLEGRGLTISCGVAIGRSNYPFYLLLDLAEMLLKNAKRAGSEAKQQTVRYGAPAYIDFHVVSGASSYELKQVRADDYFAETPSSGHPASRTFRPMSFRQAILLKEGVGRLRKAGFPRSKLHDLLTAALTPSPVQAQQLVREVFSRCRKPEQRDALWQAVARLCPGDCTLDFPWYEQAGARTTAVADLAEAFDLFPQGEHT